MGLRLLPSRLPRGRRAVYRTVVAFFVVELVALVWPVAALFSRAEPLVAGLPFFLFYLVALLLASFAVLLGLFVWEGRTGASSDPDVREPEERP